MDQDLDFYHFHICIYKFEVCNWSGLLYYWPLLINFFIFKCLSILLRIGIVEKKLEDLLYEIKGWEDKIKRNEERVCIYTCIIIRRSDV